MDNFIFPVPAKVAHENEIFTRRHVRDSYNYVSSSHLDSQWMNQNWNQTKIVPLHNVGRHLFPQALSSVSMSYRKASKGAPISLAYKSDWGTTESYEKDDYVRQSVPTKSYYYTIRATADIQSAQSYVLANYK